MSYINFINTFKQNCLAKKKYYYFNNINKKTSNILYKFIELGLIKNIQYINKNYIKIYPTYVNEQIIFKNLKILYKPSNKKNINIKTLQKIKKYKHNCFIIMLTPKGLLTNIEALNNNTGGILLLKCNL